MHGQFAGIPIVVQVANAVNQTKPARAAMEKPAARGPQRLDAGNWPRAGSARARRSRTDFAVKDGVKTPGKVAIFSTCYINYNEPGIGHDLLKVLDHNEVPYVLVSKEKCCGMPKLELGDLDSVNKSKEANIPVLAKYAQEGYAILTAVPSCTLMFKQELPLMYPDDADVQAVKEAMWDPFEYLCRPQARRPAQDRLQPAAGQGELPRSLPQPGAEHRPQDRGDAASWCPAPSCRPTSAARATPAPSA